MNDVERMQGQLAALSARVEGLEKLARARANWSADDVEAQKVAQLVGFPVEILVLPEKAGQRRRLAKELKSRGWSSDRISRVLNCSHRTIERWMSGHEADEG